MYFREKVLKRILFRRMKDCPDVIEKMAPAKQASKPIKKKNAKKVGLWRVKK